MINQYKFEDIHIGFEQSFQIKVDDTMMEKFLDMSMFGTSTPPSTPSKTLTGKIFSASLEDMLSIKMLFSCFVNRLIISVGFGGPNFLPNGFKNGDMLGNPLICYAFGS